MQNRTTFPPRTGSLHRLARFTLSLALLSTAAPGLTQTWDQDYDTDKPTTTKIQNPSFDAGPAGWTWKSYIGPTGFPGVQGCSGLSLSNWQPPAANFVSSGGRTYASLKYRDHNWITDGPNEHLLCSEASQLVTLPAAAKDMVFAYKLGTLYSFGDPYREYRPVVFKVIIEPTNGSASETVFSASGSSSRADVQGQCISGPNACPEWREGRTNLTRFAGQTVKLRFVSGSSEQRRQAGIDVVQSVAFLDEVQLVDAPPPQVSLQAEPEQVLVPDDRAGLTRIRWSAQNVDSLDITVSVDGAAATPFAANVGNGSGSRPADSIQRGRTYQFRAQGRTYPGGPIQVFDQVLVHGLAPPPPSAVLTADPAVHYLEPGTVGTSVISWTHQNLSDLDVFVSVDGAPETTFGVDLVGGPTSQPADWIQPGRTYQFRAVGRDLAGSPPRELHRITVYGIEMPSCGSTAWSEPNEGWYNDDARANTAMQISPRGDFLIWGWLTYSSGGDPVWYFGLPERDECGRFVGAITRYQRDPSTGAVTSEDVGEISLAFTPDGRGEALYGFGDQTRSTTLTHFVFGSGTPSLNLTGFYADATRAHSGSYLITQGETHLLANYVFDAGGQPVWTMGWGPDNGSIVQGLVMQTFSGTGRCPLCDGDAGPLTITNVGNVDLYPQGTGIMLFNGTLSGGGLDWDWFWTVHGQL